MQKNLVAQQCSTIRCKSS